jgi:hypothetical protein
MSQILITTVNSKITSGVSANLSGSSYQYALLDIEHITKGDDSKLAPTPHQQFGLNSSSSVVSESGKKKSRRNNNLRLETGNVSRVGETGAVWDMGLHGTSQF